MKCSLTDWKHTSLLESLPGLEWKERKLKIDASHFSCCEGRGLRWDAKLEVARSCKLQKRKRNIDSLLQNFESTWPEAQLPGQIKSEDMTFFLRWLNAISLRSQSFGYLISSQRDSGRPGIFCLLALLSTWRFGIRTHVFTLGRSKDHDLIPDIPSEEYPLVYFLDNVNELWKPKYKEQVSTVINWCEQSEVPLWMEIRELGNSTQEGVLNLKESFRAYISKMKSRPVLNWLDEECLSRLLRVCSKGAPSQFLKEFEYANMDT